MRYHSSVKRHAQRTAQAREENPPIIIAAPDSPSAPGVLSADQALATHTPSERKRLITRERIIATGVEIGFPDLSIKEVARRLGVTPPAIYKHITDRKELNLLVGQEIFSRAFEVPAASSVRDCLILSGCHLFEVMLEHAGLFERYLAPWFHQADAHYLQKIIRAITAYGYSAECAQLMAAYLEVIVIGQYFHTCRIMGFSDKPHDYTLRDGGFCYTSSQVTAMTLVPAIDGLLATIDDPADSRALLARIRALLPPQLSFVADTEQ